MLKWLTGLRRKLQSPQEPSVDPAQEFEDPLAGQTKWTPQRRGGASFRTHKTVEVSPNRVELRMTIGMWIFGGIFTLVGAGMVVLGLLAMRGIIDGGSHLLTWLFTLIFGGVGVGILYFAGKPRIFDKRAGYYWKGWGKSKLVNRGAMKASPNAVPLEDIHALQIVCEYCSSDDSSYYSYELNLVLQDASRVNVTDHGNHSRLRSDAELIAEFLDVPVWEL